MQAQGWRADERLRIYLTNTLEQPAEMQLSLPFAEFISDEANAALSVKRDEPLLVILGNPPYPQDSANPSREGQRLTFIGELIEDYMPVDGQLLGIWDQKKPLQSDYVKFVRWAQWRIDKNGEGVIGYIVNNSFLDGSTSRGMRQSLLNSFDTIYHLNLHGSNRITEIVPEAERDENVFDIIQGVSILLCVKKRNNPAPAKVYYTDMYGNREEKYNTLSETDVQTIEWCELQPTSPYYLFVPQAIEQRTEYELGWEITDIFHNRSIGIATARDTLTLHRTVEKLRETVTDFVSLSVDDARQKYRLREDTRDWKVHLAQADLRNHSDIGTSETAQSLWLSAATYKEHIAPMLDDLGRELEGAIHRISAASCYEKAGHLERAVNLYRAALSGPLRDDTREEVENMLSACLVALNRQSAKSIS